jgi:hypothetical protein
MELSCTKKVLDFLGETPAEKSSTTPLYDWHVHMITMNRRKMLLLLNNQTHLVIALYGIRSTHKKSFKSLVVDAMHDIFHHNGYSDAASAKYFQDAGVISFVKTDRSLVASMNQLTQVVRWFPDNEIEEGLLQRKISDWLSRMPTRTSGHWIFPCDEFKKAMGLSCVKDVSTYEQ